MVLDKVEFCLQNYFFYMLMIFDNLVESKVGCSIDNLCMNHVMYADDICLMALSLAALRELIHICYDFSVRNDLSFNSSKSYCMVFKPKSYTYHVHYYIWTVKY